jgi:Co/Zn/Cd efflux system component
MAASRRTWPFRRWSPQLRSRRSGDGPDRLLCGDSGRSRSACSSHSRCSPRASFPFARVIHVIADAAVSAFVIGCLILAWAFGWLWMDPLAGIIVACVIASWSNCLMRDTGAILLDMNPDRQMAGQIRAAVEAEGDQLTDLPLWRLGPGHIGAIVSVLTSAERNETHFRTKLGRFHSLSHLTIEVREAA